MARKAERERRKRSPQFKALKSAGLELSCYLGMPAKALFKVGSTNSKFSSQMNALELFSGAGGMALGIENAGFRHAAVLERDSDACATIRRNQSSLHLENYGWPVHEMDVRSFNYDSVKEEIQLLAGGPPCQPFSLGGKHAGYRDERNMFPEVFRAIRALKPKAVLIENVRGLGRSSFSEYFNYILTQLKFPEVVRRSDEKWKDHFHRVQWHAKARPQKNLTYDVHFKIVNAADYGVPQARERVFIVAFRSDLCVDWSFPKPSHSLDSLLWDQVITGAYWEKHQISKKKRATPSEKNLFRLEKIMTEGTFNSLLLPWRTVRDAIGDLPSPHDTAAAKIFSNHKHNPGARIYPGHTGSHMDLPSKTLKAGMHGVPGGENTLLNTNGKVRYFTVRECARIQTFPDTYVFPDVWSAAMKQLGNAVPVRLAEIIARSIGESLTLAAEVRRRSFRRDRYSSGLVPEHSIHRETMGR